MTFGEKIKKLRLEKNLSQSALYHAAVKNVSCSGEEYIVHLFSQDCNRPY